MDEHSQKAGVGFWCTIIVVALLMYPISFGPACWITSGIELGSTAIPTIYRPVTRAAESSPAIQNMLQWYARLFARDDWWLLRNEKRWGWGRAPLSRPRRIAPF